MGNDLFGAFGRDFVTADGKRLMIVAITDRQWSTLVAALGIEDRIAAIEAELGVSFSDEGVRFQHRHRLIKPVQDRITQFTIADLATLFDKAGVLWSVYRKLSEAMLTEPGFVLDNPVFAPQLHPAGFIYPTPGAAATFASFDRGQPPRAPRLGEHTDEILSEVLKLSSIEIAKLHDSGIVAGPTS
jgi:2-methylfumaryl-CoA isomerase